MPIVGENLYLYIIFIVKNEAVIWTKEPHHNVCQSRVEVWIGSIINELKVGHILTQFNDHNHLKAAKINPEAKDSSPKICIAEDPTSRSACPYA